MSVLKNYHDEIDPTVLPKGKNAGHDNIIEMHKKRKSQGRNYRNY